MAQKMNGLYREMIVHPGETLKDILSERNIPQNELAVRAGVSPKHVSKVLNGENDISATFAQKLEYALGIESGFWMNLQNIYDSEILEFNDLHSISDEEYQIFKNIKEVCDYCISKKWITLSAQKENKILELRKFYNVSNLQAMRNPVFTGAFKSTENLRIIPEVVFAWQKVCELSTCTVECRGNSLEISKALLQRKLFDINNCRSLEPELIIKKLTYIFSSCGIAFAIVPSFKGAPLQGYISQSESDKVILCLTNDKYDSERFWFTLFHEIGHFLNGDAKRRFLDFNNIDSKSEKMADLFAREQLSYTSN